jgi:diguanylate cyclase (GGDEF)-like protein/PAS domain S-box-containing protein
MRLDRRSLRNGALILVAVVLAHALWLVSGLPGRRVLSDVLFIAVPALGAWRTSRTVRRLAGRARACWIGFGLAQLSWALGNGIWAWYELVHEQEVPTISPGDVFYVGAFVGALFGTSAGLLRLVRSRAGAWRVLLDVCTAGGALALTTWMLMFVDGFGPSDVRLGGFTWIYPALNITVATLAFAAMTHVPAPARPPWLSIAAGFLVLGIADTGWAYANLHGGFVSGSFLDPFWVLGYGLVALAAKAAVGTVGLDSARARPSRWEVLGVYAPLVVLVPVFAVRDVNDQLSTSMRVGGLLLALVMAVRQALVLAENDRLARTLESRVDERTAELANREAHFRSIVTSISDVVLVLDSKGFISFHTPVERLLGYEDEALVGSCVVDVMHPDDLATMHDGPVAAEDSIGKVFLNRFRHRDGSWHYLESRVTELIDHPGLQGMLVVLRDVGDRVELEERLRHQAYHDSLTGLANRSRLHEELESALLRGRTPSLLLVDLDEFKAVNDTAGHDLGDDVLVAVARRLRHATRPGDIVSRLGGDEFAVLLPDDPDSAGAMAVAERVLHALRLPLTVKQRSIRCLGSIGVAAAGPDATAAGLLRDADVAMYAAKAGGKGRIERFTPHMRDELFRRQGLEDVVRRAVAERRLVLHYQPVIDFGTGATVGAEALLRLRGDDGKLVSPVDFVQVAEELGLINEIGARVLVEACRTAAGWQQLVPGARPIELAVNLSTRQLHEPDLLRQVAGALELAGLPPHLLTLEITEGALGDDGLHVETTLHALRQLGVRLSIDDFGAGYSSLGRLRTLPVDEFKIDRSFVAELAEGGDAPLVDAILAMAASLGLRVVAEGIETETQAEAMRARGCQRGQGYLFSRPVPGEVLERLLVGGLETSVAAARS